MNKLLSSIKKLFAKKPVCQKCGSKDLRPGEYTRAWNAYCKQAAGEHGFYCMSCQHITFDTPDFEEWLAKQMPWIVRKHGDPWRSNES